MRQSAETPPTRDDIMAILQAHRDLGPDFDQHLADQLLELVQKPQQPQQPVSPQAVPRRSGIRRLTPVFALSIPLMAIAGGQAGKVGVLGVIALDVVALIISVFM